MSLMLSPEYARVMSGFVVSAMSPSRVSTAVLDRLSTPALIVGMPDMDATAVPPASVPDIVQPNGAAPDSRTGSENATVIVLREVTVADSTVVRSDTGLSSEAAIALSVSSVLSVTAPAPMSSSGLESASNEARCCAVSVNFIETPSVWPGSSLPVSFMPPEDEPLSLMSNFESSTDDARTVSLNVTVSLEPSYEADAKRGAIESSSSSMKWPFELGTKALPDVSYIVLGTKYRLGLPIATALWRLSSSSSKRTVDVSDETARSAADMVIWPVAGWLAPSRRCTLVAESLPTSTYSLNVTDSSPVPL